MLDSFPDRFAWVDTCIRDTAVDVLLSLPIEQRANVRMMSLCAHGVSLSYFCKRFPLVFGLGWEVTPPFANDLGYVGIR